MVQITEFRPGDRIAASSFTIGADAINDYIEAVEESSGYFAQNSPGAVAPPLACVGLAMAASLKEVEFPEGAIHLSQEIRLSKPVRIGQTLYCRSSLMQDLRRRNMRIITIRLEVDDNNGEELIDGKTSFMLSEREGRFSQDDR